jgi:hypothetical protein
MSVDLLSGVVGGRCWSAAFLYIECAALRVDLELHIVLACLANLVGCGESLCLQSCHSGSSLRMLP